MSNKEMKTLAFGDVTYEIVDEKARNDLKEKIPNSEKGKANGVASLDETGKVPKEQLPELGGTYGVGGNELGLVKNGGNVVINPDGTMTAPESTGGGGGIALPDSAASHNAIFRGEDLTGKYTVDQICERISSGTFEDLYIGDYFDITFTDSSGSEEQMRCILAAFDYYYTPGEYPDESSGTSQHHALIVPKNCVSGSYAINTNYENYPSEKGFINSTMFTTTLPSFVTPLQTALNNHIIQHKNRFVSALNADGASAAGAGMTGYASSWSRTATYLNLLSEVQVYGTQIWSSSPYNVGCDAGQLPLFAFDKTAKRAGAGGGVQDKGASEWYDSWWLRDLVSAHDFAYVNGDGSADYYYAYYGDINSLRPFFLIG